MVSLKNIEGKNNSSTVVPNNNLKELHFINYRTCGPGFFIIRFWFFLYTALGHNKEDYSNATYMAHILEALKWVMDKPKPDYKKAKAKSSLIDEMKMF